MRLYLMRHGEAVAGADTDANRALTEYGESCARRFGAWLRDTDPAAKTLVVSPYLRAQQTAGSVLDRSPTEQESANWLTPDSDPFTAVEQLGALVNSGCEVCIAVTHQPLISGLIGLLVEGSPRLGPPMSPASVACLDIEVAAAGCADLFWLRHAPDYTQAVVG